MTFGRAARLALRLAAAHALLLTARAQIEVTSNGNVGIGTNAPARIMHLVDSSNDAQLRLGGGTRDIAVEGSTGAGIGQIVNVANVSGQSRYQFGDAAMTLRGGKVGVGVAAPVGLVDIWNHYSSGVDSLRLSYHDGSAYWMGIQPYVVGSGNVGYKFRTNNITTTTDALAITGNGNIGIGTNAPIVALHIARGDPGLIGPYYNHQLRVDSNLDAGIVLSTPLAKDAYFFHNTPLDGASAGFKFGGAGRYIAFFTVNGTERMRIDNVGNVGIGTTSPSHKLQVVGSVRATSFIADTNTYADFVFAPDYRLPSLSEVEAHIQAHGHLPGVPDEAEARRAGIDLAAMQVKLLQKIEELTLHQIRQEKRLQKLEAENAELRAALAR